MTISSPCVGICKLDEASSLCVGCARTGDEIALWGSKTDDWRTAVWNALPARFEALDISCRRLPWTTEDIRTFVSETLTAGSGTWVIGVVGALGEFTAAPGKSVDVRHEGENVIAETPGARLRFLIDDDVRALTFEPDMASAALSRIVLAVERERKRPPTVTALTDLGPDRWAIDPRDRDARLFDLGLGRKEARFCIRWRPGAAQHPLSAHAGTALPENLHLIRPDILAASPARVIENALGRVEIETPMPPLGTMCPDGPHAHLIPDGLASGRAMPAGLDLPRAYLPGAIFYQRV